MTVNDWIEENFSYGDMTDSQRDRIKSLMAEAKNFAWVICKMLDGNENLQMAMVKRFRESIGAVVNVILKGTE